MYTQLILTIEKLKERHLSQNISSLLQGVLMEQINPIYGEKLHLSQLKPYSQQILMLEDKMLWKINTLDEEAKKEIIEPLMVDNFCELYLRHKDLTLKIQQKEVNEISEQLLLEKTFFATCERIVKIEFVSPTAFKRDGSYVFYPTPRLIFQSLMNKYDACSQTNQIYSDELLVDIENQVMIVDYKLRSLRFHLEGITIPSFKGEVTFKVNGPQQLVNIIHLLLWYGEYSGVGIKSAIGMGGIRRIERGVRTNDRKRN